ncbi:MAG: hypothetical protein ACKVZ6_03060 [Kineosporiaceae bacterium]
MTHAPAVAGRADPLAARVRLGLGLGLAGVLAATAGCTSDEPSTVGDPAACAGRVTAQTLDTTFPGYAATVGGFGERPSDGGSCAVRGDGRRLAVVTVERMPSQDARRQSLDLARDTSSPPPRPTDLGPDVVAGDDGDRSGGLTMLVGEYTVVVSVEDAKDTGSAVAAAVALARDVRAYYLANPPPSPR